MLMFRHLLGKDSGISLQQRNDFLALVRAGREKLLSIPATLPAFGADAEEFQAIIARVDGAQATIDGIYAKLTPEGEEPAAFEEYPALTLDEGMALVQWGEDIDRMAAIIAAHGVPSPVAIGAKLDTGTIIAGVALVTAGVLVVVLS